MAGGVEPISPIAPQSPIEHVTYQKKATEDVQKIERTANENAQSVKDKDQDSSSKMVDVVAVSEDGDTVQVSEEGKDQLVQEQFPEGTVKVNPSQNMGIFLSNADRVQEPDEESDDEKISQSRMEDEEENFSTSTTSYVGYTDARLEQMYLEGDISRFDYEQEMERREQLEQDTETKQKALSDEAGKFDEEMKSTERTQDAIQTAFSDEASQTTDPKLRLDMMEKLDQLGQLEQSENQRNEEQQIQFSVG